jgi:hypothetical protein
VDSPGTCGFALIIGLFAFSVILADRSQFQQNLAKFQENEVQN